MIIENSIELPISPAEAWPLLTDVARVAPCMPGAKLTEAVNADTWRGELAVRLGPVGMRFLGDLRFVARNPEAGTARAMARAQEARNRGSADALLDFRLLPAAQGTRVEVVTDLVLAGQVAQYGRGAGVVARVSRFTIGRWHGRKRSRRERSTLNSANNGGQEMNSRFHGTGSGRRAYATLALATTLIACASPLKAVADVNLHARDAVNVIDTAVAHHFQSSVKRRVTEATCYFDPEVEKSMRCRWRSGFARHQAFDVKLWEKRELRRQCGKAGGKDCIPFIRNGKLEFDGLSPEDTGKLESILQKISSSDPEAAPPPEGFRMSSKFRNRFNEVKEYWDDYRKKNRLKNPHYALCANDQNYWASFSAQGSGIRLPNVRKMCVLKCNAIAQWYAVEGACYVLYEDGQFANAAAEQAAMGGN